MTKSTVLTDRAGNRLEVPIRPALPTSSPSARYTGFHPETLLLNKGSIRLAGYAPLPCDIVLERDVAITLRDGTTIYTDVFRPNDDAPHPAIVAMSPYGKQIGTQWLDDIPGRAGVAKSATSGLHKFEGPDPAYWVNLGYAVINPDVRGAYNSEGIIQFFGSDYGRDGADIIEWAAAQPWSNGRLGMSGNSWLAISQWFVAAENPPHLAAIAPWEGLTDCLREVATRGGVPMPAFIQMLSDSFVSTPEGGIEDCLAMMRDHPTMNSYWEDKQADLAAITIPAYVVASYTNPLHTNGSIDGFQRISSQKKWLRIHNTGEWDDYYHPDHVADLRRFFDHFLLDEDNGWEETPPVRLSVLNPGGRDIVDRPEQSFPPADIEYSKLFLDAKSGTLTETPIANESSFTYDSGSRRGRAVFNLVMSDRTELVGPMKLRVWVSAADSDDMDLAVKVEKRDRRGRKLKGGKLGLGAELAATGYIRASMRALDPGRSTEAQPFQSMAEIAKLTPGEIVPVDIAIWPMGLLFEPGDQLRLTITAHKTKKMWTGPFKLKMAKLKLPKSGFTRMPNEPEDLVTIGGGAMFAGSTGVSTTDLPKDCNKGRHTVHTGGHFDSFLYLPLRMAD